MWGAMCSLWRYGLVLVHDVPETYADAARSSAAPGDAEPAVPYMGATEALAKEVGFVRRTLYGGMWAFGTYDGTDTGNDSAYSSNALEPHTDGAHPSCDGDPRELFLELKKYLLL